MENHIQQLMHKNRFPCKEKTPSRPDSAAAEFANSIIHASAARALNGEVRVSAWGIPLK
jgi:hypothetical protein